MGATCKKFASYLKSYDMFPVETQLRFDGDPKYNTWIGFVISLAFIPLPYGQLSRWEPQ